MLVSQITGINRQKLAGKLDIPGSERGTVPGILLSETLPIHTPVVPIKIGSIQSKAILDTGADVSIMSEQFYKNLPKQQRGKICSSQLPTLKGVAGHCLVRLGSCKLPIKIGKTHVVATFEIVKGISKNILIGSDILAQTKATLDYNERTLKIGNEIVLLQRKTDRNNRCLLLRTKAKQVLKPEAVTCISVTVQGKYKPGDYCVVMLDNAPILSEQPGLLIPNSLITIGTEESIQLPVINTTFQTCVLPGKITIASAEQITEQEIDYIGISAAEIGSENNKPADHKHHFDLSHVPLHQRPALEGLLQEFNDLFATRDIDLGCTHNVTLKIDTGDHPPIKQKPYRTPFALRPELERQIEELLKADIIRPSNSPWSSPMMLIPKGTTEKRLVIDYRRLNQTIVKNSYPLPNIEDILSQLGKCKFFTKLEFKSGYWQIGVEEADKSKTAFVSHHGLFEWNRMPFGICTAPSIFQSTMNKILGDIVGKFCYVYIDDVIICTKTTFTEHLEHLSEVFRRIRKAGMKLKPSKCEFLVEQVLYLGHVITTNGTYPDPDKVRVIKEMTPPETVKQVRSFVGMAGYYRKYIANFSEIARPLTNLTRKNARFSWGEEEQNAFDLLREYLTKAPILAYPDIGLPYKLYTDASQYSVGAILTQDFPEGERVIQFVSHQLSDSQKKWSTIERETYSIIFAIGKLRPYLFGSKFTVYTDHQPLRSLFTSEMKNIRIQRWAIMLSEYDCTIKYRPGSSNIRADMLSRLKVPDNQGSTPEVGIIDTDGPLEVESDTESELENNQSAQALDTLVTLPPATGMKELQGKDSLLAEIIEDITQGTQSKHSNEYVLEDGLLYHIATPVRLDPEPRLQLVIPTCLVGSILEAYHDNNGHLGIDKSYHSLRSRFFWPLMYRDLVQHIGACIACNARKLRKKRVPLQDMRMPQFPFEILAIDTSGPFVESFSGNIYMITLIDHFSGWICAYPVPDKSAATVARILLEEFIPIYSCPSILISDQGTEYVNAVIEMLSAELNIHRIQTSAFHPASNGKCELSHKSLNNILAKSLDGQDQRNWDKHLPAALLAHRTSVSEATKMTPFFVVFGRDPQLPMDTLLNPKLKYMGEDYVPTMLGRLHEAYIAVKQNQLEARERNKFYYNQRAEKCNYQVGDPVFYLNKTYQPHTSPKLTSPWQPYYRIVEQLSPVNFKIRHQPTGKTRVVHAENIRAAHPEAVWDKPRDTYQSILNKYKPKKVEREPDRVQPIRQARLMVPNSLPQASTQEDYQTNTNLQADPHLSGGSDPLNSGPDHRYDLRPRPTKPGENQTRGKRHHLVGQESTHGESKRPRRDSEKVDNNGMDVDILSFHRVPDQRIIIWVLLGLMVLLTVLVVALIALLLK